MIIMGIVFVSSGLLIGIFKWFIAYDVARDPMTGGGVPTLDGVIFPPILITVGLFFFNIMSFWWLVGTWLLLTAFFGGTHWLLVWIGKGKIKRISKNMQETSEITDNLDNKERGLTEAKQIVTEPIESERVIELPLSRELAEEMILMSLRKTFPKEGDDKIVILSDQTIEKPYGWIFFWSSIRYGRTRKPEDTLIGASPIFVNRRTGQTEYISLPDISIEKFLARLKRRIGLRPPWWKFW